MPYMLSWSQLMGMLRLEIVIGFATTSNKDLLDDTVHL